MREENLSEMTGRVVICWAGGVIGISAAAAISSASDAYFMKPSRSPSRRRNKIRRNGNPLRRISELIDVAHKWPVSSSNRGGTSRQPYHHIFNHQVKKLAKCLPKAFRKRRAAAVRAMRAKCRPAGLNQHGASHRNAARRSRHHVGRRAGDKAAIYRPTATARASSKEIERRRWYAFCAK